MKKTLLYREIDGHKIVTGISRPTVDGVATNRAVIGDSNNPGLIQATDEWQTVEAKKAEYAEALKSLRTAQRNKNDAAYKAALSAMDVRQDELKPLVRALEDKLTALRIENAVYFEPRKGEVIRDTSEVDGIVEAIKSVPQGILIDLAGGEVSDNRGAVFFRKVSGKWQRTHIVKLGDAIPGDAVLEADVTPEQAEEIERDRVAALPADIRLKEKGRAMALVLKGAQDMRSTLEIQGDPDALTKSQDWYNAEVTRITGLYG